MADTGAPWNLPYPLPTDLVRDGADAIKDLAEAVADGLDDAGSEGIGPNVVQTVLTTTVSISSTSLTNITGLSVAITPSDATSKVLVIASVNCSYSDGGRTFALDFTRNGTPIAVSADGFTYSLRNSGNGPMYNYVLAFLDSPNTTSATTYQARMSIENTSTGTGFVNRAGADSGRTGISTITAIEVAA